MTIFLLFALQKIKDKQMLLRRLADIAIDLYAMTACIARTSRSFSMAVENCETEVTVRLHLFATVEEIIFLLVLAVTFCQY